MIEPFWNRIPQFFTYPFTPRSAALIVLLAVMVAALYSEDSRGMSGFLATIASLVMLKYSFAALRRTAHGDLNPPEMSQETISEDFHIVFMVSVIYGMVFGIGFVLMGIFGIGLGLVGLSLLMFLVPAMVIVLATSTSVGKALNPYYFGRLAARMGKGYLIMYLFCQILQAAPLLVIWVLSPHLPPRLTVFLYTLALNYYTLVTFHLMGYAILQYHEEIGYEVEHEDRFLTHGQNGLKAAPATREQALVNRLNIHITDGRIDEAIALVKKETGGEIDDLEVSGKYYHLLKAGQKTPELLEHAQRHLELLLRAGKKDGLETTYRECVELDRQFTPSGPLTMRLAENLSSSGDPREAVNLLNRFIKKNPDAPQTPHAYLKAADIFLGRLMDPHKAVQILRHLKRSYPDHEIMADVEQNLHKISLSHGIQ